MDTDDLCVLAVDEDGVQQPTTVLTIENVVHAVFPWGTGMNERELERAQEIANLIDRPVVVYEVDARRPMPPAALTPVDPVKLGWVEIGVITPERG
jgi:hypothetical protein